VEEHLIMSDPTRGTDRGGRRAKRFLTPSQKYEIFLQLVRQQVTMTEAAEAWKVDRLIKSSAATPRPSTSSLPGPEAVAMGTWKTMGRLVAGGLFVTALSGCHGTTDTSGYV
jgi:hypothetical protein